MRNENPNATDMQLSAALLAAGDLVYTWDIDSDRIDWWGDATEFLASQDTALVATGERFHGRLNPEDLPHRLMALSDHYASKEPFDCEYRLRQADGNFAWVHDRGQATFTEEGKPQCIRGVLRLVNRRKAYEAHLEHIASYDELTGHYNRTRLRDALQHTIAHHQRYGGSGGYLLVGIDKLALINETVGYQLGDALIIAAGQRIERSIRQSDIIGRVGGDQYGIVLQHCSETELLATAEKILRIFRESPLETVMGPVDITVSMGGVVFPDYISTAFEVMAKAEEALGEAKRGGRDCFVPYRLSARQRDEHRQNVEIGDLVKESLQNGRLVFAYQPVVEAGTHKVQFYECLLRIRNPDDTILSAGQFIPTVEKLGLSRLIDRRVLEMAVQELIENPDVTFAINISGFTAADRSWLRALTALVKDRHSVARRMIIEITETAAIQDIEETARFVNAVRELGARVAIDDFGVGYTSFLHLKALAADIVKIDGSFVLGLESSEENRLFIRSLTSLSSSYGLTVVAECVENASVGTLLEEDGVQLLQGYHFGRPSLDKPWLPAGIARTAGACGGQTILRALDTTREKTA